MAGGEKLAGILLEREGEAVIVGFGVNLAHGPSGLERPATSLAALTSEVPEPCVFVERLAETFARLLECWRHDGLRTVRSRWLAAAHPIGTALYTHTASGQWIDGLFDGLDDSGALRLRLADGTCAVYHAGDVFLSE
jgi:BirA family biotin operon repressor/biotin-[acetyl-CoA-carboxylase] ligase